VGVDIKIDDEVKELGRAIYYRDRETMRVEGIVISSEVVQEAGRPRGISILSKFR